MFLRCDMLLLLFFFFFLLLLLLLLLTVNGFVPGRSGTTVAQETQTDTRQISTFLIQCMLRNCVFSTCVLCRACRSFGRLAEAT
jgi:hypothetical protein